MPGNIPFSMTIKQDRGAATVQRKCPNCAYRPKVYNSGVILDRERGSIRRAEFSK